MIIECGSCNSRFRLDESRITGRGARVRCRKCGEAITVLKEDAAAQDAAGAAAPAEEEGLDLRSILRESLETPEAPAQAAEPTDAEALQSELDKMMADASTATAPEPAAAKVEAPPELQRAEGGPQTVDFGPEEELTFLAPGRKEPPAGAREPEPQAPPDLRAPQGPARQEPPAAAKAPPPSPPPPSAPASSPEFMMSTADSLDFLKADYDKGEHKAALDISGSLRVAPAGGPEEQRTAPPLGTQRPPAPGPAAEPPSRSEQIRSELESLGGTAGAAIAGAAGGAKAGAAAPAPGKVAAPPPPRAAAPPPPPPLRDVGAPRPSAPVRRAPAKKAALKRGQGSQLVRPSVVLLLLLFFALAGGGAYLGFTADGQKILQGLVPQVESLWLGGKTPLTRYQVGGLIGYYEANAAAGKMFVVKGQVTNEGATRKVGVLVYAALLDAQKKKLDEKTVYAGNVFTGEMLRQATREKIETAMSNPIAGGLANIDLPPGKSVPFMVVFFDAPDGIDSYQVEPRDVE